MNTPPELQICDYVGGPILPRDKKTMGFLISRIITLSMDLKLL